MNIINCFNLLALMFMCFITWVFVGLVYNKILNSTTVVIVQDDGSDCSQEINQLPILKRTEICTYDNEIFYKYTRDIPEKPFLKFNFLLTSNASSWLEICENFCTNMNQLTGKCETNSFSFSECERLLKPDIYQGCTNLSKPVASINNIPFYPNVVVKNSENYGDCVFQ